MALWLGNGSFEPRVTDAARKLNACFTAPRQQLRDQHLREESLYVLFTKADQAIHAAFLDVVARNSHFPDDTLKGMPSDMGQNRYHHLGWLHGIELFEAAFSTQTFSRHAHEGFAIGAIAEGVGGYLCRGETMVLPTGSLSLMNPEEPHTGYAATPWLRYNMLYASEAAVCAVLDLRSLRGFSTVALKDKGLAISQSLSALAAVLNAPKSPDWHLGVEEAVYSVLSQSFVQYGRADLHPAGRDPGAIATLRERISSGVTRGDDLSLSVLAETVGLNPSYLIRATRRQTGLTPHGLVMQARVEQAHRLLLRKTPAAEAAVMAGFYDQAHLIRQYRRHFGVTPGAVVQHS